MKKIFSIILICFWSFNLLVAQERCITPSPLPPSWIFQKSASQKSIQLYSVSGVITLNIFVHIVRSTNGQGLNTSILSTIFSNLNNSFTSSNILFLLEGSDYIDDDNFYGNLVGKENQLFGINTHTNAINIYVLGTSTNWGAAGMAQSIPSIAYIVHGNYYNTSSLPHEMGHCLGLYHTHHGTVTETGGDINQCSELVNASNSTTCGDYISDTRADPNVWSSNSCNYSGALTDINGQFYNPDPSNLMSYSYKPCRNLFTPLQSDRMNNFILNTQILQNVIHYEISGPSQICNQGTFTINDFPSGATVTWSAAPSNTVSLQPNGNSVVVTKISSGVVTLTATINNSLSITKTISVSPSSSFGLGSYSNFEMLDDWGVYFKILPSGTEWTYRGNLTVSSGSNNTYTWSQVSSYPNDIKWTANGANIDVYTRFSNKTIVLRCVANSGCNSSTKDYTFTTSNFVLEAMSLSPNPASNEVSISLSEEEDNNGYFYNNI